MIDNNMSPRTALAPARPGRLRPASKAAVVAVLLLSSVPLLEGQASAAAQWQPTGSMISFHGSTAIATLRDGRILAVSGADGLGELTPISELYDPVTGAWSQTGSVHDPRMAFHNPVVLPDGRVLIAGGHDRQVNDYASAEIYDPATGVWATTGSLNTSRRYAVTVGLQDGRVLVATGAHGVPDGSRFLATAEIYDPATGQWTLTGSASTRRESATGIRLQDGRVMVVGGYTCCDFFTPATDVYNPLTGAWTRVGDRPHGGAGMALAVLPDGRVLMAGGGNPGAGLAETADALLFDPANGQWSATAALHHARSGADALVLADGRVLVAGGSPRESEIYDPATATWSVGPSLNEQHGGAKMALLPNGGALIAGGYTATGFTTSAEIYVDAASAGVRADFTSSPEPVGRAVRFDASGSTIPADAAAQYRWDFDSNGAVDRVGSDPVVTYEYPDTQPRQATLHVVVGTVSDSVTKPVTVPVDTVLLLLPGIKPLGLASVVGGAYDRARSGFDDLLRKLGCELDGNDSVTKQCNTTDRARLYWSPYSYAGPNGQAAPQPYGGLETYQALSGTSLRLDEQIGQILVKHPGARLVLVGHSNGGAVATYWAGSHQRTDIPIVTLDSPVYGFWPENRATAGAAEDQTNYCGISTPWNRIAAPEFTIAFQIICAVSWNDFGFRSDVSYDWRGERTFGPDGGLGGADPLQLFSAANRFDGLVPPWWSASPAADANTIVECWDIPTAGHSCVLDNQDVVARAERIVLATTTAALQRQAPTLDTTLGAWGTAAPPNQLNRHTTQISAPANARIIAIGQWGPVGPAADGARHGDGVEAGTLHCAYRPTTPTQTVTVSSDDWRAGSYVVFWRSNARPNLIQRSRVRTLPYLDTEQYEAAVSLPDIRLNSLSNPCPAGGSS